MEQEEFKLQILLLLVKLVKMLTTIKIVQFNLHFKVA